MPYLISASMAFGITDIVLMTVLDLGSSFYIYCAGTLQGFEEMK